LVAAILGKSEYRNSLIVFAYRAFMGGGSIPKPGSYARHSGKPGSVHYALDDYSAVQVVGGRVEVVGGGNWRLFQKPI
jgi:hypothetical protein